MVPGAAGRIEALYASPRERHPLLGSPAFALPSSDGWSWEPLPGEGNWLVHDGETAPFHNRYVDVQPGASGNVILCSTGSSWQGRAFLAGRDNLGILIGSTAAPSHLHIHFAADDQTFYWGADCTSNTTTFELGSDGSAILVGRDCMFSAFIDVKTSDDHAIIDLNSGEQINPGRDVVFQPHAWVGLYALILKGVEVGAGSIVAARSVVSRSVPPRCVVGGHPASILRTECSWLRDRAVGAGALDRLADLGIRTRG